MVRGRGENGVSGKGRGNGGGQSVRGEIRKVGERGEEWINGEGRKISGEGRGNRRKEMSGMRMRKR